MTSPEAVEKVAIRAGCEAADIHLTCYYPGCGCKGFPRGVKAAITAYLAYLKESGMVVAPKIPTDAMREAGFWSSAAISQGDLDRCYIAMIAAYEQETST